MKRRVPLKIAITADNHLTTLAKHPERFKALENIFHQCGELHVQLLIIAGDLFDQSMANYSDFEELYRKSKPKDLTTIILPGNHDHQLRKEALAGEGLLVYSEPALRPLNDTRQILFLPYCEHQSMGEAIAPFADLLTNQRWILVSHGDWMAGQKPADPYEPGVYMPLTTPDLKRYQPELAFLGHIHIPQDNGKVYYPGSPCPLNITETGIRRFLTLDTQKGEVTSHPVDSPLIFFDESFLVLPGEKELEALRVDIQDRITSWDLPDGWAAKVQVHISVYGSSSTSRNEIMDLLDTSFAPFKYYQGHPPALDQLVYSLDEDKAEIAAQIQQWIKTLEWDSGPLSPDKSQITREAIKIIYQATS